MDAGLCWINANGLVFRFWENLRESEIFEQDDEDRGSADPVVEDSQGRTLLDLIYAYNPSYVDSF